MRGGLRDSLSLMYSSMHPLGGGVNRVERTLLNFFVRRGVRGGFSRVLERRFAGDFWGSGEARMGGFAAEFRGFWPRRGCDETVQRTADTDGHSVRKNF